MTAWRFLGGGKIYNLAQWQALGEDSGSTATADPLFVCPSAKACGSGSAFDFHLQSASPALASIHFQPFEYRQAGRVSTVVTPPALAPAFPLQLPAGY